MSNGERAAWQAALESTPDIQFETDEEYTDYLRDSEVWTDEFDFSPRSLVEPTSWGDDDSDESPRVDPRFSNWVERIIESGQTVTREQYYG